MNGDTRDWLARFRLDPTIGAHVRAVIDALPEPVRRDLMTDPSFTICEYTPAPDGAATVPVGAPGAQGSSRSVALKSTLAERPAPFVRWLVAHELAHAHLRNAGRFPEEDPEDAANALAAAWGFPYPYGRR